MNLGESGSVAEVDDRVTKLAPEAKPVELLLELGERLLGQVGEVVRNDGVDLRVRALRLVRADRVDQLRDVGDGDSVLYERLVARNVANGLKRARGGDEEGIGEGKAGVCSFAYARGAIGQSEYRFTREQLAHRLPGRGGHGLLLTLLVLAA